MPAGSNYTVRLEGTVSGGTVNWRGEKTGINVSAGSTTNAGTITMSYIGNDTTPPTVNSTNPTNNATSVPVTTTIIATFSEKMALSSINTLTFILKKDTTSVSGSVIYDSITIRAFFIPSSNLDYNTTYIATITTGVTDMAANHMTSNYTWSFTTESQASSVPSAPTGVTATAADKQVTITWNAVNGATSYNIYWSTTSGVTKTNGTKISNVTSPYNHTGLTNGTPYYYVVTAINSYGESSESSQVSATPSDAQTDTWIATGAMNQGRVWHSATLLYEGKVLIAGGATNPGPAGTGDFQNSAEIYDIVSGTFFYTGKMNLRRGWHFGCSPGVVLLNNGDVLIAGGFDDINGSSQEGGLIEYNSTELYKLSTETFSYAENMTSEDGHHTAILLQDGRVLIAGHVNNIYDPYTGIFSSIGAMIYSRIFHTATLLPNGKVLITGGHSGSAPLNTAEIFDPVNSTFTQTGNMKSPRWAHKATLLPDGRVLITGGSSASNTAYPYTNILSSVEVYDPSTGQFSVIGDMNYPRLHHTATLLLNGKVLLAGGYGGTYGTIAECEIYNPYNGIFTTKGSMIMPRFHHLATLLPNGKVLVTGGSERATEIYTPSSPLDSVSPLNSSITINNNANTTNSRNVILTLAATDNIGIFGYYVSESPTTPLSVLSTWMPIASTTSYFANVPFTLSSGNGTKTVYVWFKDVAGNVSSVASYSIVLQGQ